MRTVIVSGSRADKGPLTPVAKALGAQWLILPPTPADSHLDVAVATAGALGAAAIALHRMKPDRVVVLGDRFEILAAATAAHLLSIPIIHLSGGDITEGSQDNSMRHAITKLAHLHFTTHKEATDRIISMGEEPWRVFTVGCPGIDYLKSLQLYSFEETILRLGVRQAFNLVAYQAPTLATDATGEVDALLEALRKSILPCVFTTINADFDSLQIERKFDRFCLEGRGVMVDMDSRLYLSAIKHCTVMIGNSSSGYYEAPTLRRIFVDVGSRQDGRINGGSVIRCKPVTQDILTAMAEARRRDVHWLIENPYGQGDAAQRIKSHLDELPWDRGRLLIKKWGGPGWDSTQSGREYMPVGRGDDIPMSDLFSGQCLDTPLMNAPKRSFSTSDLAKAPQVGS